MEGFLYEVNIEMKDKSLTKRQLEDFINDEMCGVDIISIKDNTITLSWPISKFEGPNEIEETLYYVLKDSELGRYTYRCIKSKKEFIKVPNDDLDRIILCANLAGNISGKWLDQTELMRMLYLSTQ